MLAYILLTIKPMYEHDIYLALYKSKGIDEIYPLFGEYDIICRLEGEDEEQIGTFVEENIKTMDGVLCTKTLMGF